MAVTQADIRQAIDLVYGEHVARPAGEELTAMRRVLDHDGVTVDTVRLLMLIVGTSPKFWAPMFETACARGWGARTLEKQLRGLRLALAKDPSAPGNRAGEAAYHEQPKTPEDLEHVDQIGKSTALTRAEVEKPWRELIDEAHARGLTGPAMARWVFAERGRRTGNTGVAVVANQMLDSMVAQAGRPDLAQPTRRAHVEPQRVADTSAPKRHQREPEHVPEPDFPDDDEPRGAGEE